MSRIATIEAEPGASAFYYREKPDQQIGWLQKKRWSAQCNAKIYLSGCQKNYMRRLFVIFLFFLCIHLAAFFSSARGTSTCVDRTVALSLLSADLGATCVSCMRSPRSSEVYRKKDTIRKVQGREVWAESTQLSWRKAPELGYGGEERKHLTFPCLHTGAGAGRTAQRGASPAISPAKTRKFSGKT